MESGLDSETTDQINKWIAEEGLAGVKSALMNQVDQWKNDQLHIAVIGESGVGKSSYINNIRDLKPKDKGAAKVGVKETTMEMKAYTHPIYPNLAFWDVPGVGTTRWPQNTYLKDIDFEKYDFYLILTANRFKENDIWLAQEVQKCEKKYFFVRTKIDQDLDNAEETDPDSFNRDATMEEIRADIKEKVAEMYKQAGRNFKYPPIFLISNKIKHKNDFEFLKLKEKLIEDFPALKKEAILLVLSGQTQKILEQKKQMLQNRIHKVAIMSAIGGAIPIPGVSFMVDIGIMKTELELYREQFGLDQNMLSYLDSMAKNSSNQSEEVRWRAVRELIQGVAGPVSEELIEQALVLAASETAEDLLSLIPVVGSLVAAGISYGTTCVALHRLLNETADKGFKALEMINAAIKDEAELD